MFMAVLQDLLHYQVSGNLFFGKQTFLFHCHLKLGLFYLFSSVCVCVCVCNIYLLLLSHSVVSDSFQPHGLQNSRLPCPLSPRACSNSCPLSSNTIQPPCPVVPFSSCQLSSLASGSFPVSQLFASGGQSGLPLYMCTHTLFSLKKEGNATICDNMHGPKGQNGK